MVAGAIRLDERTSEVTIISTGLLTTQSSFEMFNYMYVTAPSGSKLKATFHQLDTGSGVYFNVYDSANTDRLVSSISVPSAMPGDMVFSGNQATFSMSFPQVRPGAGFLFTVSIAGMETDV